MLRTALKGISEKYELLENTLGEFSLTDSNIRFRPVLSVFTLPLPVNVLCLVLFSTTIPQKRGV